MPVGPMVTRSQASGKNATLRHGLWVSRTGRVCPVMNDRLETAGRKARAIPRDMDLANLASSLAESTPREGYLVTATIAANDAFVLGEVRKSARPKLHGGLRKASCAARKYTHQGSDSRILLDSSRTQVRRQDRTPSPARRRQACCNSDSFETGPTPSSISVLPLAFHASTKAFSLGAPPKSTPKGATSTLNRGPTCARCCRLAWSLRNSMN